MPFPHPRENPTMLKARALLFCLCLLSLLTPTFADDAKPAPDANGDFTIGPPYAIDPDLTDKGNPKGKSFQFAMKLADSKIFPGNDKTRDAKKPVRTERKILVYVPAAYKDGDKAPILVTLDGPSHFQ